MDGRLDSGVPAEPGFMPLVNVELTRRNLLTLLAKLDGNPPDSACTIAKIVGGDNEFYLTVKAVEDFAHYGGGVQPGSMHEDTERALAADSRSRGGIRRPA